MDMFCYQCQETARGKACTVRGVCGKPQDVAALQDLLTYVLKGISYYGARARALGITAPETERFLLQAMFSTITNVNFHADRFVDLVQEALRRRDDLAARYRAAGGDTANLPDAATWSPADSDRATLLAKAIEVGVMADPDLNEDVRSLRSLLTYGLRGLAAYAEHAYVLEHTNDDIPAFMQEALAITINDDATVDDLVAMVMRCGEMGVQTMALLDDANTSTYGHPEPTQVNIGVREGPAILVSGHDLRDLDDLLQQTEGKGINVYTHGEMLPANAYPAFKKYPHLVGNYGSSWWHQRDEFEAFGGPIVMTTNCLVEPRDSYRDRIFTTSVVGWPGVQHIPERPEGGQKDFSAVIAKALTCDSPKELETGTIPIGFAHNTVLSVADKVIEAIQAGALKRFVVMAGCDGRHKERQYYTDVARALPEDTIILTAGCAKYRYNKLGLGEIGGIPRVLDAGQCNDSYSLVVIALKLAEALGIDDVNALPIEYDIAWYEQKAVIVLLALLSLGVKNIRLGPTLPAFISPNVLNLLVDTFNIKPITTVEQDVAEMTA
ncbi:MAG TPA: hydroxylamine reductase [Chloroflexi bacterium]|jgi:hydroxylamine reductase|nr:hydroxylamine reductase [Chloroflexota bacterium]